MKITFPHMGKLHVVLNTLFTSFGLNVLVPPPVTKKTLELGAKHSPETACLPFKINLGNFIQALEQGADTIITCGGVGPCRLGYYAEIQKNILRDLGYSFDMFAVEPELGRIVKLLKHLTQSKSWLDIYWAFRLAGAKLGALDELERQAAYARCRELVSGQADILYDMAAEAVEQAGDCGTVNKVARDFGRRFGDIIMEDTVKPLRVGIVGEIYVMREPFINQDIVRRLGRMRVEVHDTMRLGDYVNTHVFKKRLATKQNAGVLELAAPYLGHYVGGHGIKSVGHTVKLARENFDGIVHVFPFTCMPEVIAKNVFPQVCKDTDIPVLSLAFDEQTGEAGVVTRLEAFTDLLRYRRRKTLTEG